MEQHKIVNIDGRRVHYRDEGIHFSKTVVLLHGFLQTLDVWTPIQLKLMHEMRVVTIDLLGHGYTDCSSDIHTMEMMADTVYRVLDEIGVEKCVMIGHSMGGYVALAFAERYPYMLKGLGLIHSHALQDTDTHRNDRMIACSLAETNKASYVLSFINDLFDPGKRSYLTREISILQQQCLETSKIGIIAAQKGMSLRPNRIKVLTNLDYPILFIYGKNDPRVPIEIAVSQAMVARKAEIMVLDGVAHMAHFEECDYVGQKIKDYVMNCYIN